MSRPVLALPDFNRPFRLTTDASTKGIAYILSQCDEQGKEHVISYGGRGIRDSESRWAITRIEELALVEAVHEYSCYLQNQRFEVLTDHISLTFLRIMKISGNNRLARWALYLQPFRMKIRYKRGVDLTNADAISRLENLPHQPRRTIPMNLFSVSRQANVR